MATAIRLIATGAFGDSVVTKLREVLPDTEALAPNDLSRAFMGNPSLVVLALWRPSPGLCQRADRLAAEYAVPWLPVILEHPVLRIGPYVHPGQGPCFDCYQSRRRQHDEHHRTTAALYDAYDAAEEVGPGGHLPHHARLAAATAVLHIRADNPNTVTTVRLSSAHIATHRVVACHGCGRCGPSISDPCTSAEFTALSVKR
ncbi:TOMM precursor leader peptide-binding protein [Streptomyces sp. NPDC048416]|uniref:TOMM precursor leader peptide-binding protein n=1 Tax=Streptomyces sp. NPDC048416 TaxID=3365546 RepID=UPI003710A11E